LWRGRMRPGGVPQQRRLPEPSHFPGGSPSKRDGVTAPRIRRSFERR
jgi:hypothetical protein